MRSHRCSIIIMMVIAWGCAARTDQPPMPVQSHLPHVQQQGPLVISTLLCRSSEDCEGAFSVDPVSHGLLPLHVVIDNTGEKAYVFSKSYVEIVSPGGDRLQPIYFDQVLNLAQQVSGAERPSLWRKLFPGGDAGQALAAEVQRTELANTMILANQRYGGFVFFLVGEEGTTYQGGVLRIRLKSLTRGEDVTFEFSLS